jgi:hypothetical protein
MRYGAFRSRCMKCDPFPCWTITKCSKTAFSLGVKWASVGRGAAPSHRHWHQGPAIWLHAGVGMHAGVGRVDSARVSHLKLRNKATELAPNPVIPIMIDVCNHAKGGSLFQSGCPGIQAVVVDHVTGARHQQTCNHASKQAKKPKHFENSVCCRCNDGILGA